MAVEGSLEQLRGNLEDARENDMLLRRMKRWSIDTLGRDIGMK